MERLVKLRRVRFHVNPVRSPCALPSKRMGGEEASEPRQAINLLAGSGTGAPNHSQEAC